MNLLVFVSENDSEIATGPTLFVPDTPDAVMPPNPYGLEWRYFATIADEDELLPIGGREGIEMDGYYITSHLI